MNQVILKQFDVMSDQSLVFKYFIEEDKLREWLCYEAVTDPYVDGRYELYWEPDEDHQNSTEGCRITVFEKPYLIAFDWKGPRSLDAIMNQGDPLTHVSVMLYPLAGDRTRLILQHSGFGEGEDWQRARMFFNQAWELALQRLVKLFEK
ncbi:MAG TPA: SRPBCC domain-containing protein [Tissierellia bacterium]|nr:SRPBCC domain-containing protein [Tissierellia bacterium]